MSRSGNYIAFDSYSLGQSSHSLRSRLQVFSRISSPSTSKCPPFMIVTASFPPASSLDKWEQWYGKVEGVDRCLWITRYHILCQGQLRTGCLRSTPRNPASYVAGLRKLRTWQSPPLLRIAKLGYPLLVFGFLFYGVILFTNAISLTIIINIAI